MQQNSWKASDWNYWWTYLDQVPAVLCGSAIQRTFRPIRYGPMRPRLHKISKVDIARVNVSSADGIESAFDAIAKLGASGVVVQFDFLLAAHKQHIIALATERRLPTVFGSRTLALEGGLISYGPDLRENFRRGATYIDSILKGARPSDLPVYQPSRLELVLNLKAAKALGLSIPPSILLRADEVIE